MLRKDPVEKKFEKFMRKTGVGSFIQVDDVRRLIEDGDALDDPVMVPSTLLTMLTGLMDQESIDDFELVERFANATAAFYNKVRREALHTSSDPEGNGKDVEPGDIETLQIEEFRLPPLNWSDLYESAYQKICDGEYHAAAETFDEVFDMLLEERTTHPEIYRIYGNAGLAYMLSGEPKKATGCWVMALTLNPKYAFAQDNLTKLREGEYDEIINHAIGSRMIYNMERTRKEMEELNPEIVDRWSEDKVLRRLGRLGIEVTREEFIRFAERLPSTDEISRELLYPQLPEDDVEPIDDDFVWMAAKRLWALYCPDEPAVNFLDDILRDLDDRMGDVWDPSEASPSSPSLPVPVLREYLDRLEPYILTEKEGFLDHWVESYEYNTETKFALREFLSLAIHIEDLVDRVSEMVDRMVSVDPDASWMLVEISRLVHEGEESWKAVYDEMCQRDRSNCYLQMWTVDILQYLGQTEPAEKCLEDALEAVNERAEGKFPQEPTIKTSVKQDYFYVLNKMEDIFTRNGTWAEKKGMVEEMRDRVEEMEDEPPSFSGEGEDEDRFMQLIEDLETQRLMESVAVEYFDYLNRFGINFETPDPVKSDIHPIELSAEGFDPGKRYRKEDRLEPRWKKTEGRWEERQEEIKGGTTDRPRRKGPCPCGSGLMYKRCCGKRR